MLEIVFYLLGIAVFFCLIRLFRGPSVPDRIISLDAISSLVIALIVLLSIYYKNSLFLDIGIVYAVLAFIGTLVISKYLLGKKIWEE
jgi:multicomponent Na+:H+ antiporter subunit F